MGRKWKFAGGQKVILDLQRQEGFVPVGCQGFGAAVLEAEALGR